MLLEINEMNKFSPDTFDEGYMPGSHLSSQKNISNMTTKTIPITTIRIKYCSIKKSIPFLREEKSRKTDNKILKMSKWRKDHYSTKK